ncbi:MAG: sugar phosphate isomerase/epimerase [Planctomycetaceae bacterium]|nr:sugar phosphate isomerase/epimerase [Planctomycetaceae bacterium]
MKYGMNLLLWGAGADESVYPLLESCKSWGFDGIELPMFDFTVSNYEKLGVKLQQLELLSTAVTICNAPDNPISPDAGIRRAAVKRLKSAVDCCAAMGATHLVGPIHSAIGEFVGRGRTDDEWKWGQEVLAEVADHGQANNVTLVAEYLNRFECYLLNCAEDAGRFVREVGHSHLKTMYDTFHANIEEKDIHAAVQSMADQMVHVHISENDRSTPGEGGVDWDSSFAAIKEANYDGWLMIEAFGLALPEIAAATKIWRRMFPSEEHVAREGLKFMKSRWENE